MILRVGLEGGIYIHMDDEINDSRPTPEVVADYLTRMRDHVIDAQQQLAAFDVALFGPELDRDTPAD